MAARGPSATSRFTPGVRAPWRGAIALAALAALVGCRDEPASTAGAGSTDAVASVAGAASRTSGDGPPWRPAYERPPVIDAHAHIATSGLGRLQRVMETNGLSHVVNLSGGSTPQRHRIAHAMQQRVPGLVHFYNPQWRDRHEEGFGEREAERLERAVERYGYRGLKISKALGLSLDFDDGERIPVDWRELDPLWAKAGELGVPVTIHTGDPEAFWDPISPANERFEELLVHPSWSNHGRDDIPPRSKLLAERDRMIARHPETTFICAHVANNPEDLEAVDELLETHDHVYVDLAARVPEIGRHSAERVRRFFIEHHDRILFGTDLGLGGRGIMLGSTGYDEPTMADVEPFYRKHWRYLESDAEGIEHPTPIQGYWTVDAIDLPAEVLDEIYRDNAMELLDLEPVDGEAPRPRADAGNVRGG